MKPVRPVANQEGVGHGAPGSPQVVPSTSRPRVFQSVDVRCNACGVEPGEKCRNRIDNTSQDVPHDSRAKKADELTRRWAAWHGDKRSNQEFPPL